MDLNPNYAKITERILTEANNGNAKALGDIGKEMGDALKRGGIESRSLTPLGFAAGEAQRQIAAGKPFNPKAMAGTVQERWVEGVTVPARLPLTFVEKIALLPGVPVVRTALSVERALGDFGAAVDGPVQTPEGNVLGGYGRNGKLYTLHRNKITGEDLWLDQDLHALIERGTPMTIAALAVTGSIPLKSMGTSSIPRAVPEAGTLAAAKTAVKNEGLFAGNTAPAAAVAQTERLELAIQRTAPKLPHQLREHIAALRTPDGGVDAAAMNRLMSELPELKGSAPEDLRLFAAQTSDLPAETIAVRPATEAGGAKGASGAPVFLARDANGALLGAIKVFPGKQESVMGAELSAMQMLADIKPQNFGSIRAQAAAKLPGGSGVLMLSPARGKPLDDLIIRLGSAPPGPDRVAAMAQLSEAVKQTGLALAELHSKPLGSGKALATALDGHIKSATENAEWIGEHIAGLEKTGVDLGLGLDSVAIREHVNELVRGVRNNPGSASLAHGDFHPGNVFYGEESGITLIDNGGLHHSMDRQGLPIGSPAQDVAKFDQMVSSFGVVFKLSNEEVEGLRNTFQKAYSTNGPALSPEAARFFAAGTALRQFKRTLNFGVNSEGFDKHLEVFKEALELR